MQPMFLGIHHGFSANRRFGLFPRSMTHAVADYVHRQGRLGFIVALVIAMLGMGSSFGMTDAASTVEVSFINASSTSVYVVFLVPLTGECGSAAWFATGWYIIEPGESASPYSFTLDGPDTFYFYVLSTSGWTSPRQGEANSTGTHVINEKFSRCIGDNTSPGGDYYWVDMNRADIEGNACSHLVTLYDNDRWKGEEQYCSSDPHLRPA